MLDELGEVMSRTDDRMNNVMKKLAKLSHLEDGLCFQKICCNFLNFRRQAVHRHLCTYWTHNSIDDHSDIIV